MPCMLVDLLNATVISVPVFDMIASVGAGGGFRYWKYVVSRMVVKSWFRISGFEFRVKG